MSTQQDVEAVVREIQRTVDDVEDVVVATSDGLAIAASSPGDRADKVAAMAASVLALSHQTVAAGADDGSHRAVIRGSDGCLVVQAAGGEAVLAVKTGPSPNMGLIQIEVPTAATALASILA